jgi:hypothetical protein
MVWDSANLRIKGAEDWAALVEREALERVSWAEVENSTALSSARADAVDLAWKVILPEDELVEERRARETSEREHREHFEELTLLQTWGSELCHVIVGPPWTKNLFEGMRLAAICHTEMVVELAAFWAAVSSTAESMLKRSASNIACTEVVGELAAEFQKVEGCRSKLERPAARICDLLLGPPSGRACLTDRLDEAAGQLREELAAQWEAEVEAELEALRSSAARVQDLVLGSVDGSSSLVTSMSVVAEQLEGRIDIVAANGFRWGSRSALVAAVLHFRELDADLEVLGSRRNVVLTNKASHGPGGEEVKTPSSPRTISIMGPEQSL